MDLTYYIRPYESIDRQQVLDLLNLNVPLYFAPSEVEEFIKYLDQEATNQLVVEADNKIIGSGGYLCPDDGGEAKIAWDFIHPTYHGFGIGKKLTRLRIDQIWKKAPGRDIIVRTSQFAFGFYSKSGFVLEDIIKDYWAEGYDMYFMRLRKSRFND